MKLWHCVPALLLFSSAAFAKNYGMAGCGLGSLVIKSNDKIQILAATLNGTAGSQTFGITSGTSNCLPANKAAILEKQQHFVMENLESLRRDMVKGDGEYLASYAEVLGCPSTNYSDFAELAKAKNAAIFRAPGAVAVLEATKDVLRQSSQLQTACVNLI